MTKESLVLGASLNPSRYSNMAIKRLVDHQLCVKAIGNRIGEAHGVHIGKERKVFEGIDTVLLYLNPFNQVEYYDYIFSLKPRRVIFNPGTENAELKEKLEERGIEPVFACSLVMLATGQY